jgi:hypothetical protein
METNDSNTLKSGSGLVTFHLISGLSTGESNPNKCFLINHDVGGARCRVLEVQGEGEIV